MKRIISYMLSGCCGLECNFEDPYGWVPEDSCPVHDPRNLLTAVFVWAVMAIKKENKKVIDSICGNVGALMWPRPLWWHKAFCFITGFYVTKFTTRRGFKLQYMESYTYMICHNKEMPWDGRVRVEIS